MRTETAPWWLCDEEACHEAVFCHVTNLEKKQSHVHDNAIKFAKLYANTDPIGLDWTLQSRRISRSDSPGQSTLNGIQSAVDTATALIAKSRPRATFTTDGAEWSMQRRAKKLEKFVEGVFDRNKVYVQAVKMFRDAAVYGSGFLKAYDADEVVVEWVPFTEIVVDEIEARAGVPRQMHQRRWIDAEELIADFPEHEEAIWKAVESQSDYEELYGKKEGGRLVVVESWILPCGEEPGCHAYCIEGATLLREDWTLPRFPFIQYKWGDPNFGFYGQSLVFQLAPQQLHLNFLTKQVREIIKRFAVPTWMIPAGSRVLPGRLTNEIGAQIMYAGQRHPTVYAPNAVPPELFGEIEQTFRRMFEIAGISQMSSQSKKPLGLESGAALREFADIETQRFAIQTQDFEQAFIDLAELVILVAKEVYSRGQDHSVQYRDRRFAQTVKWSDVDMERDAFIIGIQASSILSRTPAGRKQDVIDLAQAGLISPSEARRLINHPDLERAASLANSALEHAEWVIEHLLDGKWKAPDPLMDLNLASQRVQASYLVAMRDGAPEEVLELLRRWIERAKGLQKMVANKLAEEQMAAQAAMAPPAAPAEMRPTAALAPEAMFTQSSNTRAV